LRQHHDRRKGKGKKRGGERKTVPVSPFRGEKGGKKGRGTSPSPSLTVRKGIGTKGSRTLHLPNSRKKKGKKGGRGPKLLSPIIIRGEGKKCSKISIPPCLICHRESGVKRDDVHSLGGGGEGLYSSNSHANRLKKGPKDLLLLLKRGRHLDII